MPAITKRDRLIEQTGPFDKKVVEQTITWTLRELMEAARIPTGATVNLLIDDDYGNPIAQPEIDDISISLTHLFDERGKPCKLVEKFVRRTEVVERSLGYDVEEQIDGVNDSWGIDAI